jgi:hypothetical protein
MLHSVARAPVIPAQAGTQKQSLVPLCAGKTKGLWHLWLIEFTPTYYGNLLPAEELRLAPCESANAAGE